MTARNFGGTEDGLEELDHVHARDEPVVVAVFDGKAHDVVDAVEVHVAGAELEADRMRRVAADKAVVSGGRLIAKAVEKCRRSGA
jgi:hypothetical protein